MWVGKKAFTAMANAFESHDFESEHAIDVHLRVQRSTRSLCISHFIVYIILKRLIYEVFCGII